MPDIAEANKLTATHSSFLIFIRLRCQVGYSKYTKLVSLPNLTWLMNLAKLIPLACLSWLLKLDLFVFH
jgi:hypothetical protein